MRIFSIHLEQVKAVIRNKLKNIKEDIYKQIELMFDKFIEEYIDKFEELRN